MPAHHPQLRDKCHDIRLRLVGWRSTIVVIASMPLQSEKQAGLKASTLLSFLCSSFYLTKYPPFVDCAEHRMDAYMLQTVPVNVL